MLWSQWFDNSSIYAPKNKYFGTHHNASVGMEYLPSHAGRRLGSGSKNGLRTLLKHSQPILCWYPNPLFFRKKQTTKPWLRGLFGGDKRDRTADLLNAIQALSQLSYTPIFSFPEYFDPV